MELLKIKDFTREPQTWPQKPKIVGKLELIEKKVLHLGIYDP